MPVVRIVRVLLLVVVLLALAGSAAVAGRVLLPELPLFAATATPPPMSAEYRRRMESAGHDFDAANATVRSAAGSVEGMISYQSARSRNGLGIPAQLQRIKSAHETLPESHAARRHFSDAASLLERAAAVTSPYYQSAEVRDLLNRADASWRKGMDALR